MIAGTSRSQRLALVVVVLAACGDVRESTSASEATTADPPQTSTASEGPTTTTTTTTSTSTATTSSTADAATAGTGGSREALPCVDDDECTIQDDCCACDARHVDARAGRCDLECEATACAAVGLAEARAICRVGRCTFDKVACNPLYLACDAPPPTCPPGQVPGLDGGCWSGACVLAEACDWVPSCSACAAEGLTCVGHLQHGAYLVCEPLPAACGDGPATCACAGEICEASPPWHICHDRSARIDCECPVC